MTKLVAILALIGIAFLIYLFVLGRLSQSGAAPGLTDGRLAPCPDRPNCVCSEYPGHRAHFIEPLPLKQESPEDAIREIQTLVISLGGEIRRTSDGYLAANFSSQLFRFVDDVEFRVDPENDKVHVRSASRVGHSDLGANRERVERIRQHLAGN